MNNQHGNPDFVKELTKFINDIKNSMRMLLLFFGGIVLIVFFASSFYTVEPEEEAVVIRFGKYLETTSPGLHFKLPFGIDKTLKVQVKRVHQEEFGFRTKSVAQRRTSYSSASYEDESLMLTGDLNVAVVEWVVHYQISDPYKFLFKASDPRRNIRDVSESIMRRVVGDRLVTEVLTVGRVGIANRAIILMQEVLDKYDIGVKIITVKLQDVNPPKIVRASFNEVNEAKQEQEKLINQAEEAYNKIIPEARGKAKKLLSEAEGYATSVVNRATGDAENFNLRLKEYLKGPFVTKKRIFIDTIERMMTKIEDVTIVDPRVKGIMPIFGQHGITNK